METKKGDSLEFNTGRQYTNEGQIIKVKVVRVQPFLDWMDEYLIIFNDISRGICGIGTVWEFKQSDIMKLYDGGKFTDCPHTFFETGQVPDWYKD